MTHAWRAVRVFISSTFRDMQAERDHLVRFVFPRLREELLERRIHFVDVDLRWGVTADQDAFDLCMDEIERCHPRFLCMLGGRYGWVPPPPALDAEFVGRLLGGASEAGELTAEEKQGFAALYAFDAGAGGFRLTARPGTGAEVEEWIEAGNRAVSLLQKARHPETEKSITASEVFHGALDRLDVPTFRYFYFRNDDVTSSIPPPDGETYREGAGSHGARALAELKERVRNAREYAWRAPDEVIRTERGPAWRAPDEVERAAVPHFTYPCRWDPEARRIVDLREFGDRVYRDLLASIDAEFGAEPPERPDRLAEENAALESFVEDRVEGYVLGSRRPVLEALREHASGQDRNPLLCVVGAPGSGKSALLARFYRDHADGSDALVLSHFIGVNATDLRQMLWRLCGELGARAGLSLEIPTDVDELRKAFPAALEDAAGTRRVVLMLDAVNQLDPAHAAHSMTWLPDPLPANVRVVLSALPGPALDALRRRRSPPVEVELGLLQAEDVTEIVDRFLDRYRKSLDAAQRQRLLEKDDAGNPLYLLTALEELRTLGVYEEVTRRIEALPGQVGPLFDWILARLEADPGFQDAEGRPVGGDLVARYASYLSLGRSGMAQSELADLVSPGDGAGLPANPQGNVAALRALLRPYLMQRGNLLDFFHGQVREAVQERYLADGEARREAHADIARYFRYRVDPAGDGSFGGDSVRGLSELPWHLTEAGLWDELTDTLTNFRFLERKVAEVGVVETTDSQGRSATAYTGVYQLQDDYDHALSKLPGGTGGERARRPIILTPVDFGDGYVIRCPFCHALVPFDEAWLGREMACPEKGCGGPWKVNPFKATRPSWAKA
jgi:hypothetical protein